MRDDDTILQWLSGVFQDLGMISMCEHILLSLEQGRQQFRGFLWIDSPIASSHP
jgi:hypothetical protein